MEVDTGGKATTSNNPIKQEEIDDDLPPNITNEEENVRSIDSLSLCTFPKTKMIYDRTEKIFRTMATRTHPLSLRGKITTWRTMTPNLNPPLLKNELFLTSGIRLRIPNSMFLLISAI